MEYGITFPRGGVAEQPSPWKYLTNFARASEQMGCAYGVIGDRLESGLDPFSVLTAVAEASGRMRLATSVVILPPRGILVAAKQYKVRRWQAAGAKALFLVPRGADPLGQMRLFLDEVASKA